MAQKSVFISYRRDVDRHLARSIYQHLSADAWDVFLDVKTIDSGDFDRIILQQIGARAHFILLISEGSLKRCTDANDWVLREIREALRLGRNIIPIVDENATFEYEIAYLPEPMRTAIAKKNSLPLVHFYFDAGMHQLTSRFLKSDVQIPIYDAQQTTLSPADITSSTPDSILSKMWEHLTPELQAAMAMAYNQALRNGSHRISTRYFFGAAMRLKEDLAQHFPEGALPVPVDADIDLAHSPVVDDAPLSSCVDNSLRHLNKAVGSKQALTLEDVFVDVARYGTGSSVARLRTHGVDSAKIDQIVQQLGWNVVNRK